MLCDSPSISSADVLQPTQTNWSMPLSTVNNDKKQLSFVYQPGVGLYDKRQIELDQDSQNMLKTADDSEHLQLLEHSSIDASGVGQSESSHDLQKSCLRPEKLAVVDKVLCSSDKRQSQIKSANVDISPNQENNQKRKFEQNGLCSKKLRQSSSYNATTESAAANQMESSTTEKHLSKEASTRADMESGATEPSKSKLRSSRTNHSQKQPITILIKNVPLVKKLSFEHQKQQIPSADDDESAVPSQGLLLCPKDETIKKKKKKKIAPTITSSTELLDDDSVLDSILFNEMQSVQQQWQQFLTLTMEKELHINPSDGKRKTKSSKFQRTSEFLAAYDHLYDFEGMKHWYPTSR
ncbi:unnamed protein product [Adineta ricciae]|uniref:Uncharacterized protein n=1 Tax=Adineta ricciae TaxID=249248 RepID=A0A814JJB5_ADIRI|nr:unnamed protein product [Adineta ricciae]CAF1299309.1 unnamed protein product [Adineta ricciae]